MGKGQFGYVKLAVNRINGKKFAIKIINKEKLSQIPEQRQNLEERFNIHQ